MKLHDQKLIAYQCNSITFNLKSKWVKEQVLLINLIACQNQDFVIAFIIYYLQLH